MKKLAINFLKIFIDEIKSDPKGIPSQTGTVAEISSKTLNISRRLLDHQVILETLLNEGWGVMNSLPIQNFSGLNVEIFDYLVLNLENRVKIYAKNKQVLGTVFLMNNFNYIGKILGREQKLEAMFNGMEKMNTLLSKQKSIYLNSWKPVYDHLFDSTYISAGAMSKVLTKAQRDVVKDNFKGFNQEFEDIIKTQSVWEVPDVELKATIIKDLKATLSLLYSRFHDRYKSNTGLEFSKTPEKYIKYSVEGVDSALDTLFKS